MSYCPNSKNEFDLVTVKTSGMASDSWIPDGDSDIDEEIADLIQRKTSPNISKAAISRIACACGRVTAVFPRIVNVCATLIESWYAKYVALDVNREPLMHVCIQQLIFWVQDIHEKLARKQLMHFDLQDMFISMFELQDICLYDKMNYQVAELFGSHIQRMSLYFAEIGAQLSKLACVEPCDYIRIGDEALGRSINKTDNIPIVSIPTVDQLETEGFLGAGSFGVVYRARYVPANMRCTVKIVPVECFKATEHVIADRLVASIIDHPCLITIYAIFSVENASVCITEFFKGSDLQRVVESTRNLHVEECRLVFAQMVAGLIHMHYNGIMHRDIKGSNTLVSPDGRIKLIDFDTNKICLAHYPARKIPLFFKRTAAEMNDKEKAGTLPYMAPEVIRWKAYGRAMDWWSMGITLYKLLIGRVPFHANNTVKLRQAICINDVVFPEFKPARAGRVRPAIDIVRQLLKKKPTERLGSGLQGYEELLHHPFLSCVNLEEAFYTPKEELKETFADLSVMETVTEPPDYVRGGGPYLLEEAVERLFQRHLKHTMSEPPKKQTAYVYSEKEATMPKGDKIREALATKKVQAIDATVQNKTTVPDLVGRATPLHTFMSNRMREICSKKAAPELIRYGKLIRKITCNAPNQVLEFNRTSFLEQLEAERLDIVLLRTQIGPLGFRLKATASESGQAFYVVTRIDDSATKFGLLEGDIVLAVNGMTIIDQTPSAVATMLANIQQRPVPDETIFTVLASGAFRLFQSWINFRMILNYFKKISVNIPSRKNFAGGGPCSPLVTLERSYFDSKHECFVPVHLLLE
ncbi:probable serine/threonine protein kinase IRE, partial [Varroa jacobsoni]|uniref:probable serine/threonine protein kinase IRE n=1 Tax=Varroa jacobsoni TaxID=62625 RepID=UPI000BF8AAA4